MEPYIKALARAVLRNCDDIYFEKFISDPTSSNKFLSEIAEAPVIKPLTPPGGIWPLNAVTMIHSERVDNIYNSFQNKIQNAIPGDFIETGVWRGGACIFAAKLAEYYNLDMKIWVCDSFEGLPPPDTNKWKKEDPNDHHYTHPELAISIEEVRKNFDTFNVDMSRVNFVKGWFEDTLPALPINEIAILRLDGDMYGSTYISLDSLYPKLSTKGYCIIDDWNLPYCRLAVQDYFEAHNINPKIETIDRWSCYWIKE